MEQGFLQAIVHEPDDDTHRLVYADWLDDHGDPRGEFIRAQVDLAQNTTDSPRLRELAFRFRIVADQEYGAKPMRDALGPRKSVYPLVALMAVSLWLTIQQKTFCYFDAHRIYSNGPTLAETCATADWPLTGLLLVTQAGLVAAILSGKRQMICGWLCGVYALYYTVKTVDCTGNVLRLAPPPQSGGVTLPTEPWQENWFLLQLHLDPTFWIAILLGVLTMGVCLWYAVTPSLHEKPEVG